MPLSKLTIAMAGDVLDMTGPRRFTNGVLQSLRASLNESIPMESITKLSQPKLVGDVLILPSEALSSASNQYEEGEGQGPRLVVHHYAGTWKNEHGGEA